MTERETKKSIENDQPEPSQMSCKYLSATWTLLFFRETDSQFE